jgi:hypothetical protein
LIKYDVHLLIFCSVLENEFGFKQARNKEEQGTRNKDQQIVIEPREIRNE